MTTTVENGHGKVLQPDRVPQQGNHVETSITAAGTKLSDRLLSELRTQNVPPTDDSYKYNYKAACDKGEGNYTFEFCKAKVLAILDGRGSFVESTIEGEECSLILDRTCFYAEQGGQIYDQGYITSEPNDGVSAKFSVQKVVLQKHGYILHCGTMIAGSFRIGDTVALSFDTNRRRLIMNNHTSTHILDHALIEILGSQYNVKGSLVTPDRLQLDFSSKAMTAEQIRKAEDMVVDMIRRNVPVYTMYCKQQEAKKIIGLITLPNVDYADPARVVSVGEPIDALIKDPQNQASLRTSVDFCGGTHVHRSGHIESFVITSEETLSKGFRRIVAASGPGVDKVIQEAEALKKEILNFVDLANEQNDTRLLRRKWTELVQVVSASVIPYSTKEAFKNQLNEVKKGIDEKDKVAKVAQSANIVQQAEDLVEKYHSECFMVEALDADSNKDAIDAALKKVRNLRKNLSSMFLSVDESSEKIFAMCIVSIEANEKGFIADAWIKSITAMMNGKGGGNPKWAQASGSNFTKLKEILDEARNFAAKHLSGDAANSNPVISMADVYKMRKEIAELFSYQKKEKSAQLDFNGASYYVSGESLKGGSDTYERAAILQWINFADFTLWPSVNENLKINVRTPAYQKLAQYLKYLNGILDTNLYLVSDRITLADIAVFTCLVPAMRLDANLKKVEEEYVNVYFWYYTIRKYPDVSFSSSYQQIMGENVFLLSRKW